jgi:hypothetical protein
VLGLVWWPPELIRDTVVSVIAKCEAGTSPRSALRYRMCVRGRKNVCQLPGLVVKCAPLHYERAGPPAPLSTENGLRVRTHHCLLRTAAQPRAVRSRPTDGASCRGQ